MEGKVCLITGANIGIGYIAARELARQGATVVLACRSEPRGQEALAKLKEESGSQKLALMLLDLSSMASVRKFAADFSRP